jgi:hypothetical protein
MRLDLRHIVAYFLLDVVVSAFLAAQAPPAEQLGRFIGSLLILVAVTILGVVASLAVARQPIRPTGSLDLAMERHPLRTGAIAGIATSLLLFVFGARGKVDPIGIGLSVFLGLFVAVIVFRNSQSKRS